METTIQLLQPAPRRISNGVLGMVFMLATEAMFFAGLISSYLVNRAAIPGWPPVGQPRLPVEVTAVNTLVLLASGVVFFLFARTQKNKVRSGGLRYLLIAIILGANFLIIQGAEWVKLISFGLSSTSGLYGAFFYLIIGAHAIHAMAGLTILVYLYFSLRKEPAGADAGNRVTVSGMYWYFVVGIWPLLYYLVYLM